MTTFIKAKLKNQDIGTLKKYGHIYVVELEYKNDLIVSLKIIFLGLSFQNS